MWHSPPSPSHCTPASPSPPSPPDLLLLPPLPVHRRLLPLSGATPAPPSPLLLRTLLFPPLPVHRRLLSPPSPLSGATPAPPSPLPLRTLLFPPLPVNRERAGVRALSYPQRLRLVPHRRVSAVVESAPPDPIACRLYKFNVNGVVRLHRTPSLSPRANSHLHIDMLRRIV